MATKTTAAKKPKWKKQHAERGMQMMNMAVHLVNLKDNYRRDIQNFTQGVKQEEATDDYSSVMAFLDSMDGYSSKEFRKQCLEVSEILEALGGQIIDEGSD